MLTVEANDFVVASSREQRIEHVTVTPDASNVLKRGTVLANAGGKYEALTAENVAKAEVILAEDVEAGSTDAVAAAYVSGDFVEEGLTVGTALTADAKLNLKNAGIYLVHGITA